MGQSGQSGHSRNIVGIAKYTTSSCNKDVATEILKSITKFIVTSGLAIEKVKDPFFVDMCRSMKTIRDRAC